MKVILVLEGYNTIGDLFDMTENPKIFNDKKTATAYIDKKPLKKEGMALVGRQGYEVEVIQMRIRVYFHDGSTMIVHNVKQITKHKDKYAR